MRVTITKAQAMILEELAAGKKVAKLSSEEWKVWEKMNFSGRNYYLPCRRGLFFGDIAQLVEKGLVEYYTYVSGDYYEYITITDLGEQWLAS